MEAFMSRLDWFGKENSILNRFLFPAPPSTYGWDSFPGELICVASRDGSIIPCALFPGLSSKIDRPPTQATVNSEEPSTILAIYCHANGEDIGVMYEAGHWLCDTLGVHVLVPEYPGYGCAPGTPYETSVNHNVEAAYDFAINGLGWTPKKVIFFGRSIGTGPAVRMASEFDCGGVVLVSPYSSVKEMVTEHAGFVTALLTAELLNMFPNADLIPSAKCPTLIVHGASDRVIPSSHARKLHSLSGSSKKSLVVLEGVGHHGIDLHFAVAHECHKLFDMEDEPRELNIDDKLDDPDLQGDSIASPVPGYDCATGLWSRPTLRRGAKPFMRQRAGERLPASPTKKSSEVAGGGQSVGAMGMFSFPDKVQEEKAAFEKARQEPNHGLFPDFPQGGKEGGDDGEGEEGWRGAVCHFWTDEDGKVADVSFPGPPQGPDVNGGGGQRRLFLY